MAEYTGTFTVQNNTGGQISHVAVSHYTTDWPASTISAGKLANNGILGGGIVDTSTTNTDKWSVSFINADNQLLTGQKNCGFESEDNGGIVNVVLNPGDFDINMPKSSSCDGTDYNEV